MDKLDIYRNSYYFMTHNSIEVLTAENGYADFLLIITALFAAAPCETQTHG